MTSTIPEEGRRDRRDDELEGGESSCNRSENDRGAAAACPGRPSPPSPSPSPSPPHSAEESPSSQAEAEAAAGPKFDPGQRVLCHDADRSPTPCSDLLYEAVVRKSGLRFANDNGGSECGGEDGKERRARTWCHLIHFQGWNSRWDRWMIEADIFPDDEENRTVMNERKARAAAAQAEGDAATPSGKKRKKQRAGGSKRKKTRVRDDANGISGAEEGDDGPENGDRRRLEAACELPFTLRTVLVDDSEKITRHRRSTARHPRGGTATTTHVLPVSVTVRAVLSRYVQVRMREDDEKKEAATAKQKDLVVAQAKLAEIKKKAARDDLNTDDSKGSAAAKDAATDAALSPQKNQRREGGSRSSGDDGGTKAEDDPSPAADGLKGKNGRDETHKEFASGIIALFDAVLPVYLLYPEERNQFLQLRGKWNDDRGEKKKSCGDNNEEGDVKHAESVSSSGGWIGNKPPLREHDDREKTMRRLRRKRFAPSRMYGSEHLLRLFLRLPYIATSSLLSPSPFRSTDSVQELAGHVSDFIVFLQRHRDVCFQGKYRTMKIEGGN